jgi:hypothetical protein
LALKGFSGECLTDHPAAPCARFFIAKERNATVNAITQQGADPLGLLLDRASALAARAKDGSLPFLDAVDMAYSAADYAGLVDRYGDDVVQIILADAFGGRA